MHMADALISPAVGGVMWVAAAGLTVFSARKLKQEMDDRKTPLMGVLGALVFAAQMINFTIPGTGSSGHLGGAMILAVLLGPYAAFITMASILTIQALFFADGGLLALGCNIINMGFFPCFIAFPLVYKRIAKSGADRKRILPAAMAASIAGLLLGAMGVVTETFTSGISELSFKTFILLMVPIHLVIGIVEGFVTASIVGFVSKARPEVLEMAAQTSKGSQGSLKPVIVTLAIIAALTGGFLSWFASTNPDGLEWSTAKSAVDKVLPAPQGQIHSWFSKLQEKTAFLPDYGFKKDKAECDAAGEGKKGNEEQWPGVNAGTSISGLLGGAMSLVLVGLIGFGIRTFQRRKLK